MCEFQLKVGGDDIPHFASEGSVLGLPPEVVPVIRGGAWFNFGGNTSPQMRSADSAWAVPPEVPEPPGFSLVLRHGFKFRRFQSEVCHVAIARDESSFEHHPLN